jgi:hypothetical protein
MAVNYAAALKTSRLQLVVNALGTATAPTIPLTGTVTGSMVIGTTGMGAILATIDLLATPATVAGNVLTIAGVPLLALASATGTAAEAQLRDDAGAVIVSGLTVGAAGSGADVIISAVALSSGQTVQVNSGTITHP